MFAGPFPSPDSHLHLPLTALQVTPANHLGEVPPLPITHLLTERCGSELRPWEQARVPSSPAGPQFVPMHLASACPGAFARVVPCVPAGWCSARSCWLSRPSWLSPSGRILLSDSFTCCLYPCSNPPCPAPPPPSVSTRALQALAGTGWEGRERHGLRQRGGSWGNQDSWLLHGEAKSLGPDTAAPPLRGRGRGRAATCIRKARRGRPYTHGAPFPSPTQLHLPPFLCNLH